ncbi:MAG: phosphoenolpyruvate--protein phosphotransferase, partial [candidate division Zixibacteria bacterium]|nr:phosphoenolpyruvate--protein phosphotransferase [candidate division Zixibacteria bacterium]
DIAGQPAVTADGTTIGIFANIERLEELDILPKNNIDGIGLFRTEFLFMYEQPDFPSMEQQMEWYRKTINFMNGKAVTIRILDIGGDKFLSYFAMGRQDNPYLGLRGGSRVFQYHPELLETQLRAILEAANGSKVRILYPMVNTPEDIELFKNIFSKTMEDYDSELEIGIMIETPASAFIIDDLIKEVDFVSIGTNDLVQYTLTADRNNENVMR